MKKTRKSITKRVTVTKKGKLIVRKRGQSKFRAKRTSKSIMGKRMKINLGTENEKRIKAQLK